MECSPQTNDSSKLHVNSIRMREHNWVRALDQVGCGTSASGSIFTRTGSDLGKPASSSTARMATVAPGGEVRQSRQHISGGELGTGARYARRLLGHLRTRTNAITDGGGFVTKGKTRQRRGRREGRERVHGISQPRQARGQ
ncbi:hypothetical protein K438DRAFT_1866586 [Mycena galopus ATCC 62051]|nr:hypothetical protein K438DRAFT_1866586 [Mycena galopus ATCC 62051]